MSSVSIIMPTHNKSFYLDRTLAGFVNQTFKDFEIVVVDDGSTDDTRAIVEKYKAYLSIQYCYQENSGRAKARNTALGLANGKYLIFNDDDRIPSQHFVSEHVNLLNENPRTVSIGSKHVMLSRLEESLKLPMSRMYPFLVKNREKLPELLDESSPGLFMPEDLMLRGNGVIDEFYLYEPMDNYKVVVEKYTDKLTGFHFDWVLATTGNMAVDRTSLEGLSFDENYSGWGLEDTDFAYRLKQRGFSFAFHPNALNFHQVHPRGSDEGKELTRNFEYFYSKFTNPEILIFQRVFKGDFNWFEANEMVQFIRDHSGSLFVKDYAKLLRDAQGA
ncbi:glycosyltransferase family 2 protein [Paenibacillus sp. strain BS8-2]